MTKYFKVDGATCIDFMTDELTSRQITVEARKALSDGLTATGKTLDESIFKKAVEKAKRKANQFHSDATLRSFLSEWTCDDLLDFYDETAKDPEGKGSTQNREQREHMQRMARRSRS